MKTPTECARYVRRVIVVAGVLAAITYVGHGLKAEQGDGDAASLLPLSTRLPESEARPFRGVVAHVSFEGVVYEAAAAIPHLLSIALDKQVDAGRRASALDKLGELRVQLNGHKAVEQLVESYDAGDPQMVRAGMLLCLAWSEDARALPLLRRVLATEKDPWLLLIAGGGLAMWNEQTGVAKLVELLGVKDLSPTGTCVSEEAAKLLSDTNRQKSWGFPSDDLDAVLAGITNEVERMAVFRQRWEQWFAANRERFPLYGVEGSDDAGESSDSGSAHE